MGFKTDKDRALRKFKKAEQAGEVDKPITYLLSYINSLKDFYTTSSCSGRVILLHEFGDRKIDTKFLVKEHERIDLDALMRIEITDLQGTVWFKQEPFIIHIAAKTLDRAVEMLELGMKAGLKHSGVFVFKPARYILELNGTQHFDVPIISDGKLVVTRDYLAYLVKLANEKMQKNLETRKKFEKLVIKTYAK